MSRFVGTARLVPSILRLLPRRGGEITPGSQLGDPRLPFVQLRVEHAYLPQIPSLERVKLAAKVGNLQLPLCQRRADNRQFFPFAKKFFLFRS